MQRRLLTIGIMVSLSACALSYQPILPAVVTKRSYEIGAENLAGIGEPMFEVSQAMTRPGWQVRQSFDPGVRNVPPLAAGMHFRAVRENANGRIAIASGDWSPRFWLVINRQGEILGHTPRGTPNLSRPTTPENWSEATALARDDAPENVEGGFRAQLIYSGMDGQTIRAVYREFTNDLIRPGFSQELVYDLATDSTLAYRSVRLDIIQATNSQIRYRVVDDGNLAWLPFEDLRLFNELIGPAEE